MFIPWLSRWIIWWYIFVLYKRYRALFWSNPCSLDRAKFWPDPCSLSLHCWVFVVGYKIQFDSISIMILISDFDSRWNTEETSVHIFKINGAAEQISTDEKVVRWAFPMSGPSEWDSWAKLNGLDEKMTEIFTFLLLGIDMSQTTMIYSYGGYDSGYPRQATWATPPGAVQPTRRSLAGHDSARRLPQGMGRISGRCYVIW